MVTAKDLKGYSEEELKDFIAKAFVERVFLTISPIDEQKRRMLRNLEKLQSIASERLKTIRKLKRVC